MKKLVVIEIAGFITVFKNKQTAEQWAAAFWSFFLEK
jgi:hypothetical protein